MFCGWFLVCCCCSFIIAGHAYRFESYFGLFILMFSRMKCIWLLTRRLHANSAVDVTLGCVRFKSGLFMVATEDCELWQSFVMLQHGFFCGC